MIVFDSIGTCDLRKKKPRVKWNINIKERYNSFDERLNDIEDIEELIKYNEKDLNLKNYSSLPAVSYSLYTFLKWLGFDHQKSTLYGVLGGVASLLVEVILLMIQTFKQYQKENFQYNDKDSMQFIYNHRNSIFSNHYSQTNFGQSLGKMKKD